MKINIHAGHCPDGKGACGAVGLIKESTEARKVKDLLIKMLKENGHTVYDCTCDESVSSSTCLKKIVAKCNAHKVDLDVSIHLNAGANDEKGNGRTTGCETLIYSTFSSAKKYATAITNTIAAEFGYSNRGVKTRRDLYVLRNTNAPALLVECCFVDDKDDVNRWSAEKCAKAIYKGITGKTYVAPKPVTPIITPTKNFVVRVIVSSLSIRQGAGVEYKLMGTINNKGAYTIVETKKSKDGGTWGKLKSGAGWINISSKYVTKL